MQSDTQNLKKENEQLQEQLVKLAGKLEESEKFKSHFIARISNEIVNPFTAILAMSSSIMKTAAEDSEKVLKMAAHINREARLLEFQLNNLFAAAYIESGEINLAPVLTDPGAMIDTCISVLKDFADEKDVNIHLESSLQDNSSFITDSASLKLIIRNLLDNAVKYSNKGSEIRVEAAIEDNVFYFRVENEGEKLSAEHQQLMFDRFKRLNDKIHSLNPGSGLGLSVAAELTELMKGSLESFETGDGMGFQLQVPESGEVASGVDYNGDELFFDDNEDEQIL